MRDESADAVRRCDGSCRGAVPTYLLQAQGQVHRRRAGAVELLGDPRAQQLYESVRAASGAIDFCGKRCDVLDSQLAGLIAHPLLDSAQQWIHLTSRMRQVSGALASTCWRCHQVSSQQYATDF